MKRYVIIVAGGSGTRFGSSTPKQFLPLAGRPVLMHTIDAFAGVGTIVVVLPAQHIELWHALCSKHAFGTVHRVVSGGDSRQHSVQRGLDAIHCQEPATVLIHDGVRPLVTRDVIVRTAEAAERGGAAVPVVPVTDSVRRVDTHGNSHPVPRNELRAVQTPQAFNLDAIRQAYALPHDDSLTDDAMAYERLNRTLVLVDGDTSNIKITGPADLAIAEMLLARNRGGRE